MKVPKLLIRPMKLGLKMCIPLTYAFMAVGVITAVDSLVKLEWGVFFFSLAFIGVAVFQRFCFIRMLDSIERTGTTYKWRRKIDET